jgi:predicted membrane-bound mannosyltransferase
MIEEPIKTTDNEQPTNDYLWLLNCTLITVVATFLRFYWLELKPLHHDEGVNGYFLTNLFRNGEYKYDPTNYHGPDLYYLSLAFSKVFGLQTISVRASVAIFGVFTVVLAFFLRRYIGKIGSLAAALFLALSPGMVYISRYFIHEILFVFFSFGIVVGVLYFIQGRKAGPFAIAMMSLLLLICFSPSVFNLANLVGVENQVFVWVLRGGFFLIEAVLVFFVMRMLLAWDDGRPIYLLLASASAVLLFATKETAFITVGTMAIACVCVWLREQIALAAGSKGKLNRVILFVEIPIVIAEIIVRVMFPKMIADLAISLDEKFEFGNVGLISLICYLLIFLLPLGLIGLIYAFDVLTKTYERLSLSEFIEPTWKAFREKLGDKTDLLLIIVAVTVIFIYVGVLFFSSFFTNPEGVLDAFRANAIWTKTGNKDHTQNGFWAYVKWGMKIESPIMILSVIGTLIAILKARHRFAMFTGFWALGMFAAYTIIPYKTPWLALSFLLPMCIIAGYAIGEMFRAQDVVLKVLGGLVAVMMFTVLGYQTYDLNFVRYDQEDRVYVYAHTKRGFHDLMKQIEYYAEKSGRGKEATIEIVSEDYWPMPWYLNDYSHANFHGHFVDANASEMIVSEKTEQDAEAITRYSAHYKYVGTYPLRPGVDLRLLVKNDLADSDAKSLYQMEEAEALTVTPDDAAEEEKTTP